MEHKPGASLDREWRPNDEVPTIEKALKTLLFARERLVTCMNKHRGMPRANLTTIAMIDTVTREIWDKYKIDKTRFQEEIAVYKKEFCE